MSSASVMLLSWDSSVPTVQTEQERKYRTNTTSWFTKIRKIALYSETPTDQKIPNITLKMHFKYSLSLPLSLPVSQVFHMGFSYVACPGTHYVDHCSLGLRDLPLLSSAGLRACRISSILSSLDVNLLYLTL